MSGTQEIITRRSRTGREAEDGDGKDGPSLTIEQPDQISPEDALADSRRQLAAQQAHTAEARRQARQAQQAAQQAIAQANDASTARLSDRETAVSTVLESTKGEIETAKAAYRMARETGDVEAEMAANQMLANATARLHNATVEMERIKAAPKPQPTQQQPNQPQLSAESQRWIDEHPAYASDRRYRALANAAHEDAVQDGHAPDTPEYFDYINHAMTEVYGEDHGQPGGRQVQQPAQPRGRQQQQEPRSRGDGLPPSRHAGGSAGGYKTLETPLGSVQFRQGRDGKIESVKFSNPETHQNFIEGAQTSFRQLYERDESKALAEFTTETIQEYLEGGETIKHGDGRILR